MSDPNVRLALRVHDECNGSDVFGSDICTCRPYLIFGVEEAVKEAQQGGSGVVIYFRKEGRALGWVNFLGVFSPFWVSDDFQLCKAMLTPRFMQGSYEIPRL